MADNTTGMEVLGAPELIRELEHLGRSGSRKAIQAGIRAGLTSLRNSIKAQVPPHAKSIKRSVGSKFDLRRNIAKVGVNVGKKRKRKNKQGEMVANRSFVPHAAVYVTGAKPRQTRAGHFRGRMRGTPIVQRGVAVGESAAEKAIRNKTLEKIEQEAGKTS